MKNTNSFSSYSNTVDKLHISRHPGYTLIMNTTQVRILKERDKISLSSFLKSSHQNTRTEIIPEVLNGLANQSLEGNCRSKAPCSATCISHEKPKSRTRTMRILHSSSCRRRLSSIFRSQMFPRNLSSSLFLPVCLVHLISIDQQELRVDKR